MKKLSILSALLFCLFSTGAALAQNKTAANFAGTWELDAAKSKLPERMRVESGTLVVTQTEKQLTVATDFKRAPRSENPPPPPPAPPMGENGAIRPEGGNRGGRGGGGMMGGGNGTATYALDGKETKTETETRGDMPSATLSLKAEMGKNGELKLVSSRSFETQMGVMTVKTVETWELINDGAILKITRETETPRGAQSAEMYFTRKDLAANGAPSDVISSYQSPAITTAQNSAVPVAPNPAIKMISGGVLNGKALKLVQPEYPPAAKAVNAIGTVNVQITIDEEGKVVSASAVSGHPLLRAASEKAARLCEFAPTRLSGVPVKVAGVITYNFQPVVVTTTDN